MTDLIAAYVDWMKILKRSPRTYNARNKTLRMMDRQLPYGLERATSEELKAWIFQPRFSKHTLSTYFGTASAFYVWATAPLTRHLDFNPMEPLEPWRPSQPRGIPRPVSDSQLQRILTHAAEPYRTWSLLAAYEGLRCIEISHLDREHITEETTWVVYGKGDKPAALPTHPLVWAAAQQLPPGPVAVTQHGERASENYVSITAANHFRYALKMPGVAMHRLRHWYGTTLMRQTGNLRIVQEMLRHASPNTSAVYTLVTSEERRAASAALPVVT